MLEKRATLCNTHLQEIERKESRSHPYVTSVTMLSRTVSVYLMICSYFSWIIISLSLSLSSSPLKILILIICDVTQQDSTTPLYSERVSLKITNNKCILIQCGYIRQSCSNKKLLDLLRLLQAPVISLVKTSVSVFLSPLKSYLALHLL